MNHVGLASTLSRSLESCFYCGVDSTQLIIFLGCIVGAGVLSLLCFIAYGMSSGHLKPGHDQQLAGLPMERELQEYER